MPVLPNAKHERFARAMAKGESASQAYVTAGYRKHDGNAHRLSINEQVRSRIEEILSRAAARAEVDKAKVLAELAKIGFADIRKIVSWRNDLTRSEDEEDDGDVVRVVETVSNRVSLTDSDKIDDDTAAAVAEVSQGKDGILKVKMHDKLGALVAIGKHLKMFTDKIEATGANGGPLLVVTGVSRAGD